LRVSAINMIIFRL